MNVRIVEDIAELAYLFRVTLEEEGHSVITTTHHFERLLTPSPWREVNVALVDLMLPGISGIEILEYLRDYHPSIKRIAMTAAVSIGERAIGLADRVLVKPFGTDELLRSV